MRRPVDGAGQSAIFFATILLQVAAALFHALIRWDGVFWVMAGT
jgi:cytochrome b561